MSQAEAQPESKAIFHPDFRPLAEHDYLAIARLGYVPRHARSPDPVPVLDPDPAPAPVLDPSPDPSPHHPSNHYHRHLHLG